MQMLEPICKATFDNRLLPIVIEVLFAQRLMEAKKKTYKQVQRSLSLLEYLLRYGSVSPKLCFVQRSLDHRILHFRALGPCCSRLEVMASTSRKQIPTQQSILVDAFS